MSVANIHRGRRNRRDPSPLDTARDAFSVLVAEPFPLTIDGSLFEGFPATLVPLDRVRARLLKPDCPAATRDAVWAHLVARSRQSGGAWTVGCVGMAMPALTALAAESGAAFATERSDIDAEILAGFLTALARVDLQQPWIMSRLRQAAYLAGRAAVRAVLERDVPIEDGFDSRPPPPPSRHPDFVLVRAVADGVLTDAEADLIGVTRLEDVTLHDYARAHGLHPEACASMRLRAEYRLVAYLFDPATAVDPPTDDGGVTDQILTTVAVERAARGLPPHVSRPRIVTRAGRVRSQRIRRGLPCRGAQSAVRRCGATPPDAGPAPEPPEPTEMPRCA